jgi:hypothetical protein
MSAAHVPATLGPLGLGPIPLSAFDISAFDWSTDGRVKHALPAANAILMLESQRPGLRGALRVETYDDKSERADGTIEVEIALEPEARELVTVCHLFTKPAGHAFVFVKVRWLIGARACVERSSRAEICR